MIKLGVGFGGGAVVHRRNLNKFSFRPAGGILDAAVKHSTSY